MIINNSDIEGVVELVRKPMKDDRGLFERLYCQDVLQNYLHCNSITQINHSVTSAKGAVRGLHMQLGDSAEYKIISCMSGNVFDVAVDLRRNSKTFLKWCSVTLSPQKYNSFLIPPGVAHGFQCLDDDSELLYFHTANYSPKNEFGVSYQDPKLHINWPILPTQISDRDLSFKNLSNDFSGFDL
jgi:dTDP-4-dehydrorhamnose 3,5-epimerase